MNSLKKIVLIIPLLFPILFYFPWWVGVFLCGLIGFFMDSIKSSLIIPPCALMGNWLLVLAYRWMNGGEIIMERVSVMMGINSSILLAVGILFIPLMLGSLAGFSGKLLREALD